MNILNKNESHVYVPKPLLIVKRIRLLATKTRLTVSSLNQGPTRWIWENKIRKIHSTMKSKGPSLMVISSWSPSMKICRRMSKDWEETPWTRWSIAHAFGIDHDVACHQVSVRPSFSVVAQWCRKQSSTFFNSRYTCSLCETLCLFFWINSHTCSQQVSNHLMIFENIH